MKKTKCLHTNKRLEKDIQEDKKRAKGVKKGNPAKTFENLGG